MKIIFGIGAILLGIWQVYISKQYFTNIKKQSSPVILAVIALVTSMIFAAFMIVFGVTSIFSLR